MVDNLRAVLVSLLLGLPFVSTRAAPDSQPSAPAQRRAEDRPRLVQTPSDDPTLQTVEDPRVRRYVIPRRVVWRSPGATVESTQALLSAGRGQVTLDHGSPCVLYEGAGVLVDFGQELRGGVQIVVGRMKDQTPTRLRVRFGESVSEAMSNIGGAKNATNDHAVRDQSVLVPWLGTLEIGDKGFRHSLCHGWASGPTAWLSEHVLGISILEPGGTKIRIAPHLGDLHWAEGSFPLRQGLVRVRHVRQADGSVKSEVTAPEGVEVVR